MQLRKCFHCFACIIGPTSVSAHINSTSTCRITTAQRSSYGVKPKLPQVVLLKIKQTSALWCCLQPLCGPVSARIHSWQDSQDSQAGSDVSRPFTCESVCSCIPDDGQAVRIWAHRVSHNSGTCLLTNCLLRPVALMKTAASELPSSAQLGC